MTDPSNERDELFHELTIIVVEMVVNIGIMNSIMGQMPEHVQENWLERMRIVRDSAYSMTKEVQDFGEAFDE